MKRLSFIIALTATLVVGTVDASAQGRGRGNGNGNGNGGRSWQAREQYQPRGRDQGQQRYQAPPRYEGTGRYREAQRSQRNWGRGDRLPPGYGASVPNPGAYRLRQPPPGYVWMQNGRDLYLMQQGTGLVLDAIPGGGY